MDEQPLLLSCLFSTAKESAQVLAGLEIGPRSHFIFHGCTAKMEMRLKMELVHVAEANSLDWLIGCAVEYASIFIGTQRMSLVFAQTVIITCITSKGI